jgi:hypothetical protein
MSVKKETKDIIPLSEKVIEQLKHFSNEREKLNLQLKSIQEKIDTVLNTVVAVKELTGEWKIDANFNLVKMTPEEIKKQYKIKELNKNYERSLQEI